MRGGILVAACLASASLARAAPDEIKVFTDELAAHGEHTLEVHANRARAARGHPGAPLQFMPEYSYGVARNWELSLQLPAAERAGSWHGSGVRGELQFIAPHDPEEGPYWGFNVELARTHRFGAERTRGWELIPIFGLRKGAWHAVANPGLARDLNGALTRVRFEPAAKIAYDTAASGAFGFEYYLEAGPLRRFAPHGGRPETLYFVWDGRVRGLDVNLGLGRGLTEATDRWVVKAIIEMRFE